MSALNGQAALSLTAHAALGAIAAELARRGAAVAVHGRDQDADKFAWAAGRAVRRQHKVSRVPPPTRTPALLTLTPQAGGGRSAA